jgi:RNA polymerase sigma-70 factor (sigma-E family)
MDDDLSFAGYLAGRQRALLRSAWLLTGDWPAAEDLVQTALIKVWPRWARICAGGDPDAYVRRVLFTTYASASRRRWRGEQPVPDLPDLPAGHDPEAAVDLRDALQRVLPLLPPGQRAVLVLRYYEDLSEAQTAAALGVSVGTVKSQAAKALARLRTVLPDSPLRDSPATTMETGR